MKRSLFLALLTAHFLLGLSQSISPHNYVKSMYDKDISLYKGTVHNAYPKTRQGHKYLFTSDNTLGSITVNGERHDSLLLKYDVYKQNLVLEYIYYPIEKRYITSLDHQGQDYSKASYKIDINPAFIDGFSLGKHQFVTLGESNISYPYHYLQKIPSRHFDCFIGWKKEYRIDGTSMYFSEARRKVYLKIDDKYEHILNKKGIIKKLPKAMRPEVKKFCRKLKFNTNKSKLDDFYTVFEFIDQTLLSNEN